jgi:hypothetical protein
MYLKYIPRIYHSITVAVKVAVRYVFFLKIALVTVHNEGMYWNSLNAELFESTVVYSVLLRKQIFYDKRFEGYTWKYNNMCFAQPSK